MGSAPSSIRSSSMSSNSTVERPQSVPEIPESLRKEFEEADDQGRGVLDETQLEMLLSRRAFRWRQRLVEETGAGSSYLQPAILAPAKKAFLQLRDTRQRRTSSPNLARAQVPDDDSKQRRHSSEDVLSQSLSPLSNLRNESTMDSSHYGSVGSERSDFEVISPANRNKNQQHIGQISEEKTGDPDNPSMAPHPLAPQLQESVSTPRSYRSQVCLSAVPDLAAMSVTPTGRSGSMDGAILVDRTNSIGSSVSSVPSTDSPVASNKPEQINSSQHLTSQASPFRVATGQTDFLGAHLAVSTFSSLTHRRDRQLARMAANFIVRNFDSNQDGVIDLEEFVKWDRFGGNEKTEPAQWICEGMEEAHKNRLKVAHHVKRDGRGPEDSLSLPKNKELLKKSGSRTEKYWRRLSSELDQDEGAREAKLLMAGRRPSLAGLRSNHKDLHGTVPVALSKASTASKLVERNGTAAEQDDTKRKGTTPMLFRRRSNSLTNVAKMRPKDEEGDDTTSPGDPKTRRRRSSAGMGHELLLFRFKQLTGMTTDVPSPVTRQTSSPKPTFAHRSASAPVSAAVSRRASVNSVASTTDMIDRFKDLKSNPSILKDTLSSTGPSSCHPKGSIYNITHGGFLRLLKNVFTHPFHHSEDYHQ